jgi:hypothetical protein
MEIDWDTLKWIIFCIVGVTIFLYMIYLFKSSSSTNSFANNKNFSPNMKKQAIKSAQNIFENVFFHKKTKKKRENKTENKCRNIIEKIYGKSFPSIRPDFLKNPKTGKNLELDCYNAELKIALEYNGVQHYKYSPYFHKSKKDFYSQVHRDDWKRAKCKDLDIKLLEIPHWVAVSRLEPFIKQELIKQGCL